jgi:hypothetical protein
MTDEDAAEKRLERQEDRITAGVGLLERFLILWRRLFGTRRS